jgi:hypothetical protein
VAAVDDAIADGVGVLAFPAAGAGGDYLDSVVSVAFRNAGVCGVCVCSGGGATLCVAVFLAAVTSVVPTQPAHIPGAALHQSV